jgi:putative ABC transport system ATP-binding protein
VSSSIADTAERMAMLPPDVPRDAVIVTRNLQRDYDMGGEVVHALRGVDITIRKNEFVAIMGPSGSGKSTLMNCLAGLDRATSGSVQIDGTEITTLKDKQLTLLRREKVGFVFQFFNLLPMLTAEENLELPLTIAGRKVDPTWEKELVAAVGLGDRRTHRPAELSGGQQQRVALARGLIARPAVLFADEPTGNLDSATSGQMLELLRRSADEFHQTIVMVTHDGRAASVADRVVFLTDGQIVQDHGHLEADEIYDVVKSLE